MCQLIDLPRMSIYINNAKFDTPFDVSRRWWHVNCHCNHKSISRKLGDNESQTRAHHHVPASGEKIETVLPIADKAEIFEQRKTLLAPVSSNRK